MGNPFGPLYSVDFIVLVICATFWFRIAQLERDPPWVWAGLSIGVYALTWLKFGWGIPACLLGQLLVAAVITVHRVVRHVRSGE